MTTLSYSMAVMFAQDSIRINQQPVSGSSNYIPGLSALGPYIPGNGTSFIRR